MKTKLHFKLTEFCKLYLKSFWNYFLKFSPGALPDFHRQVKCGCGDSILNMAFATEGWFWFGFSTEIVL